MITKKLLQYSLILVCCCLNAKDLSNYQERNILLGYPPLISASDKANLMKSEVNFDDLKYNMRMVSWTFGKLTPEKADAIVKKLKSQGINVVLSGGNRFITTDLKDNIEKSKIIVDACHKNNIKFVHHVTSTLVKKQYLKEYPDFTCVDIASGKPHFEANYDFGSVCFNNDNFWEDYLKSMGTLFENVKMDGIMMDEVQFWGDTLCGCKWCREKFKADTGLELPTSKDQDFFRNLNNLTYKKWLNWRIAKIQGRNLEIRALMKKHMPQGGFYPTYLCNPTYTGEWNANYQAGMQLDKQAPYSSTVGIEYEPRFFNNYYNWPVAVVEMKFAKAVNRSLDSNPWLYFYPTQYGDFIWEWNLAMGQGFNIWFPGEESPEEKVEKARSALTEWMAKHQNFIGRTIPYSNTAIVYSNNTRDMCPEGTAWRLGWVGVSQLLTDSHTSYQMLIDDDLNKPEILKNFKTLVLFNTACLSDAAIKAIREFVKNGGNLLASANVSLRDEDGTIRQDFGLADVLGASFGSYQENTENKLVFSKDEGNRIPGFSDSYKHDKSFITLKNISADRKVIGKIIDGEGKQYPGVIIGNYGKGQVIYFAGHPELHYLHADHIPPNHITPGEKWQSQMELGYKEMVNAAVNFLNPEPLLIVKNLPVGVVAESLEHQTGPVTGISVQLINCTGAVLEDGVVPKIFEVRFPPVEPAGGIDIAVKADKIKKVYLVSPDYDKIIELKPVFEHGYVKVNIPGLYRYAMLYFLKTGETEVAAINNGVVADKIPEPCKMIIEKYIPSVGKYDPNNIVFFATSSGFEGGYLNDRDIGLHTRNVFGTGSTSNSMSIKFSLKDSVKKIKIELGGNECVLPGQELPLKVTLNGKIIFEGQKMLKNRTSSSIIFNIPKSDLIENDNKLEIFNLSGSTVWDTPYIRFEFIKITPEY